MKKILLALVLLVDGGHLRAQQDPAGADQGIDKSTFDPRVRVQDDLYLAVNGTWLEQTEIPSDKSNFGSFLVLADRAQEQIRAIIEAAAGAENPPGSDAQKIGDFYKSYMNVERIEELGASPLQGELALIERLNSINDIARHFGYLKHLGVDSPIGFMVTQDAKSSTTYLSAIMQSGITLPDRDYYLGDDERSVAARDALETYIRQLFRMIGMSQEDSTVAGDIIDLEFRLAKAHWTRTQLRDEDKRYNKYAVSDLADLAEHVPWEDFFSAARAGGIEEINVMTPSFFEELDSILTSTSVEIWKKYLTFKLVDAYAPVLSQEFVDAHFELHDKAIAGVLEQQPRWKLAVAAIAGGEAGSFGALGEVAGRLYVEQHFPAENKQRMDELVQNLLRAFGQSIGELEWMTDQTKERAQEKLSKITTKIGYPTVWRDYSNLTVKPDNLFGNVRRSVDFEYQRMIDRLEMDEVDRTEWGMTPHTVNAYYNPGMNEIVFPAAILQPPFFNAAADDAVNYGSIGAVIGHEISHAFDDQGSKYDGDGNLRDWWTEEDRAAFRAIADRLVEQYETYEPLPGKHINGRLTLGENIADLSGLSVAFKAYRLSLQGDQPPQVAGWSGSQRFFLGWSQVWRRKYRDAEMVRRLLIDPHSPSWFRANGPVTNIDAFYDAFNVRSGDKLFKPEADRIRIW